MRAELTEEEWSRLLNYAALAPYREVAPLIQKVMEQLLKQKNDSGVGVPGIPSPSEVS